MFVTTLAESQDELTYTIGRAAGWLVEVLLVYLVLAFPERPARATRIDRMLVGAMGGVVLTLFLPQLILAEDFSVPSPYTSCIRDCPANALFAARAASPRSSTRSCGRWAACSCSR